jgi:hypothetical protein
MFFGQCTCPLTRRQLELDEFEDNRVLKAQIMVWKKVHQEPVEGSSAYDASEEEDDDDMAFQEVFDAAISIQNMTMVNWASVNQQRGIFKLRDQVLENRKEFLLKSLANGQPKPNAMSGVVDYMED